MRSLLLLAAVCCLVLSACGSPIARPEDDKEVQVEVGRQAAAAAAPAAGSDDDDDDEDDDDDDDAGLDLGVDDEDDDDEEDDDDDDEDEAEDEGDDDYLERFFDDILGGEEDDDDDEPAAVQPVVAAVDTVAAAPATAAVASVEEISEAEDAGAAEAEPAEAEAEAGQKEPASAEEAAPAAEAAEDDDEEEGDDLDDAFSEDDDEDDDDDEEDDGLGGLGRNNSEKHSRALTEPNKKQASVPAIYIVKYNKFVDTILDKMNDILRQSYDPVSVKLQPIDASKKTTKPKKNKTKSKRKPVNKKKNSARGEIKESTTTSEIPAPLAEENPQINEVKPETAVEQTLKSESRAIKEKENSKAKPAVSTRTTKKPPTKKQKPKAKPPAKTTTKKPTVTKNKTKNEKSKPRAKGTLYGLSSLRRTGDVAVNIMADHTTVKSNFAVGPLILKVEKVVGRGAKKEVKSATATTAEMTGKLSLRINNEGVATLHSIKVLQPKQVRVDSNHERTRELVWKRSSRIAHVVSEKLLTASKPMFHYQPVVKQ